MKRNSIWQLSVATTLEAEDAIGAALVELTGITPTSYTDAESGVTTVSVCSNTRWPGVALVRFAHQRIATIRTCGLDLGAGVTRLRRLKRENWAESWKRHFKPFTVGRRLLVKPSWSRRRPAKGQVQLILDPGLSFGTGQHATTRFCLRQLATRFRAGHALSLLDVGTGSGILAIAAAKLGYAKVDAFDYDTDCIRVARQNNRLNGVARRVHLSHADVTRLNSKPAQTYDVVCANLLANLLMAEKSKLICRLNPGGALIAAGILRREFADVQASFARSGLELVATRIEKEWQSGTFVRALADSSDRRQKTKQA
jgi:ribosomal protein L11 methyltransferase